MDPLLGGDAAMEVLLKEADKKGFRVVVDGVFNHTGRGHDAFVSLMENGPASPYADWYGYPPFPWMLRNFQKTGNQGFSGPNCSHGVSI